MIVALLSCLALAVWVYLLLARGWFWLCRERDDRALSPKDNAGESLWPSIVAVIPARDESDMIAHSVSSLLQQDYRGRLSVVLVDDQSSDGTAAVASAAARAASARRSPSGGGRHRAALRLDRKALGDAAGPRGDRSAPRPVRVRSFQRRGHPLRAAGALAAYRDRPREAKRSDLADGQAQLRKRGGALAHPGLRLLLPDALSLRVGERPRPALQPPPRAAACW